MITSEMPGLQGDSNPGHSLNTTYITIYNLPGIRSTAEICPIVIEEESFYIAV